LILFEKKIGVFSVSIRRLIGTRMTRKNADFRGFFFLRLSGVFHLTKQWLSGENT